MRIDLHCHTKQTKSGDGLGRNVTPELFREKITNANVKIAAVTNHNVFDLEQYYTLSKAVDGICSVWPGIEIDIKGNTSKKFHLIVVANPDNAEQFSKCVAKLFAGKNIESIRLSIKEVYDSLNGCDVVYISHFHKTPSISEEEMESLIDLVGDPSRVFGETADHRSLGVFSNYGFNVLVGSDVKDWMNYEGCTFSELRLPVENFAQFCMLSKRDAVIVETLLNKKQSYSLKASPFKGVSIPLKIYQDVNVIFGQKGTGKSEILKSLFEEMQRRSISCVRYTGSEKDEGFSDLLKINDMELDLARVNASGCEEDIKAIEQWNDSAPTLFSGYINWYSTRDNNANKSKMKITEASCLGEYQSADTLRHSQDNKKIKAAKKNIAGITDISEYLCKQDVADLFRILGILSGSTTQKLTDDIIEKYSYQLVDYTINKIKSYADKNSDTVSKPSSTGFREYAVSRLRIKKAIDSLLLNLNVPETNEREYLGEIEGKGKLYINRKYRMLCDDSRTAEFRDGIKDLRQIKTLLCEASTRVFDEDLPSILTDFIDEKNRIKAKSIKCFLGRSKNIIMESGEEYRPSNGEKGILLLQQVLSKDVDAYFLDEPELGMGNSYIDTNIRPLISDLAKRHKTVVVATHNANIAVRTLPYASIFRVHQNGDYSTYVGNPFNDALINVDDSQDVRSWTFESLHTLEGGEEAFYERKNIYESKSN